MRRQTVGEKTVAPARASPLAKERNDDTARSVARRLPDPGRVKERALLNASICTGDLKRPPRLAGQTASWPDYGTAKRSSSTVQPLHNKAILFRVSDDTVT